LVPISVAILVTKLLFKYIWQLIILELVINLHGHNVAFSQLMGCVSKA
jgi:hypothetical protein